MKVDIDQIESTLLERKVEPVKVAQIIKDLQQAVEEDKADRAANKIPTPKWIYSIIINDPDKKLDSEFTGWVVKSMEGDDSGLILGKLTDAARTQNECSKKKKSIITCFGELFSDIKNKFLKEKGLKVCTKTAVRVFAINGKTM